VPGPIRSGSLRVSGPPPNHPDNVAGRVQSPHLLYTGRFGVESRFVTRRPVIEVGNAVGLCVMHFVSAQHCVADGALYLER
jgi:hypothetical protein